MYSVTALCRLNGKCAELFNPCSLVTQNKCNPRSHPAVGDSGRVCVCVCIYILNTWLLQCLLILHPCLAWFWQTHTHTHHTPTHRSVCCSPEVVSSAISLSLPLCFFSLPILFPPLFTFPTVLLWTLFHAGHPQLCSTVGVFYFAS